MNTTTLDTYIQSALQKGKSLSEIKIDLSTVGWEESDIDGALARALVAEGVPSPSGASLLQPRSRASSVEVIISLFSFALLGSIVYALVTLYYEIISFYFPDGLYVYDSYTFSSSNAVHYASATLIVALPLYGVALYLWFKRFRDDDTKVELPLTKWITSLVLLIAALTLVGDLVAALYYVLNGELTTRFVLKVGVILIVAGTVFGFYFFERKCIQYKQPITRNLFRAFGGGAIMMSLIGIVLGFFVKGLPSDARARAFDSTREQSLSNLAGCVAQYASENNKLPDTLSDLSKNSSYSYCMSDMNDPETSSPYEYKVVSSGTQRGNLVEVSFELCANFTTDSAVGRTASEINNKWKIHGIGRSCDAETTNYTLPSVSVNPPASTDINVRTVPLK